MQAESGSFWEWMGSLSSADSTTIMVMSILAIIGIVTIIAVTIWTIHKNRLEDALKRDLVERGFSVEEIERIVKASGPPQGLWPKRRRCSMPKEASHVDAQ